MVLVNASIRVAIAIFMATPPERLDSYACPNGSVPQRFTVVSQPVV
jgi:hypothetical protein